MEISLAAFLFSCSSSWYSLSFLLCISFVMRSASTFFFLVSSSFASKNCCGTPLALLCALRSSDQSSFMNFPVFLSMNPVSWIWISLPFTSFPSKRPYMKLISTSSSTPTSSVARFAIQGLITSIFTLVMSTRCSNSGANFCDFSSLACLLENLVS